MSSYQNLSNFQGAWSNTVQYKAFAITGSAQLGLRYVAQPSVTYNNGFYIANGSAQPTIGTIPSSDTAWTLVASMGSSVNVLGTALTGLSPASGVPIATSTILQTFNFLSYRSFAFIKTIAGTVTANGNIPLTGGVLSASSDITLATPAINIPQVKSFQVRATLSVTTDSDGACTFAIGGANTTISTTPISVAASANSQQIVISGIVVPTAANPTIAIVASGYAANVTYASGSIQISQI